MCCSRHDILRPCRRPVVPLAPSGLRHNGQRVHVHDGNGAARPGGARPPGARLEPAGDAPLLVLPENDRLLVRNLVVRGGMVARGCL